MVKGDGRLETKEAMSIAEQRQALKEASVGKRRELLLILSVSSHCLGEDDRPRWVGVK